MVTRDVTTHRLQEEARKGEMVTSVIGRLANYDGGMVPNAELENIEDDVSQKGGKKAKPGKVSLTHLKLTIFLKSKTDRVKYYVFVFSRSRSWGRF